MSAPTTKEERPRADAREVLADMKSAPRDRASEEHLILHGSFFSFTRRSRAMPHLAIAQVAQVAQMQMQSAQMQAAQHAGMLGSVFVKLYQVKLRY